MRHRYATITAIGFAALVMVFAFVTSAQAGWGWSGETTHMTFRHPVRIPGVTLPAGSYVFKLSQNKQVVWVFSEDDGGGLRTVLDASAPPPRIPRHRWQTRDPR